ncbi:MAG: hypothetical protein E7264_11645 [Lachnospiraceae bacterium]|nr:hypothetical protein [Lachnospiraceae bacterium]
MGRQINFYMSEAVEREFFEIICSNGYKILYRNFIDERIEKIVSYDDVNRKKWLLVLYKDSYGSIIYNDEKKIEINRNYSPVIEWCRTILDSDEKVVRQGRIWISSWIEFEDFAIEEQFKKDYNSLVRWIKKKVPKQEYMKKGHTLTRYMNEELKIYEDQGYKFTI